MSISLPDQEMRKSAPILKLGESKVDAKLNEPTNGFHLTPGGPIFRLKGSILLMSFLDCNGALVPYSYEAWKDENREGRRDSK